jgi:hypothetical protein
MNDQTPDQRLADRQTVGGGVPMRLSGRDWTARPLRDIDIIEIDEWLRTQVIEDAERAIAKHPEYTKEQRQELRETAQARADGMTFMHGAGARRAATVGGLAQVLWRSLRQVHTDFTLLDAVGLLTDPANLAEVVEKTRQANGIPESDKNPQKRPTFRPDISERRTASFRTKHHGQRRGKSTGR